MRGYQKYLVGLSSAALVLASVAPALTANAQTVAPAAFTDIAGNSHANAITALAAAGVVNGIGGGLYGPLTLVTRAEMAKIVVNLVGDGYIANALADQTPSYTDASTIPTWAWGYVNVASDLGIIKGFPNGAFEPNADVTDVQAAAMLLRAIGDDHPGVVVGTYPGNYVAAALELGLGTGLANFVANLPATRAQIAQMAYNAATMVPIAQPVAGTTPTLYSTTNSDHVNYPVTDKIGSDAVIMGALSSADSSSVVISGNPYNLASTYNLQGVSNVTDLINLGVTALLNSSNDVVYLVPNSSVTPNTGVVSTINKNGDGKIGLTNGTMVPFAGAAHGSIQLTKFLINVPSTGLAADPNADPTTYAGNTGLTPQGFLTPGDTVQYTLQASGYAAQFVETNNTIVNGFVTGVCTSSCNPGPNTGGSGTVTVEVAGHPHVVTVQPYTQVTLNGQAASLSQLAKNDVVNVAIVGGNGVNGNAPSGLPHMTKLNGGYGDGNAVTITATSKSVTGIVDALTTSGSNVVSFQLSGQSSATVADAEFQQASLTIGEQVTAYLDSNGQARALNAAQVAGEGFVASAQETQNVGALPLYVYTVTTGTGTETVSNVAAQTYGTVHTPVLISGSPTDVTLTPMTAMTGTWKVDPNTQGANSVVVTNGTQYIVVTTPYSGFDSAYNPIAFTSMKNSDPVTVYSGVSGGTTVYLVQDTNSSVS